MNWYKTRSDLTRTFLPQLAWKDFKLNNYCFIYQVQGQGQLKSKRRYRILSCKHPYQIPLSCVCSHRLVFQDISAKTQTQETGLLRIFCWSAIGSKTNPWCTIWGRKLPSPWNDVGSPIRNSTRNLLLWFVTVFSPNRTVILWSGTPPPPPALYGPVEK